MLCEIGSVAYYKGGADRSGGPNWIFAKNRFTFSLGRGVGHVPGEHKPFFRAFQTHSFSEHQTFWKSAKYKYIFGPTEVGGKPKIFENHRAI